jgi:hypothetical protein
LLGFYLGYCGSESAVDEDRKQTNRKVTLKSSGYFLPLMSDWFIRPLYYLEHLENERRSHLVAAILRFAKAVYKEQDGVQG